MPFDMPPKKPDRPPFPSFKQAMDAMFDLLEKQTGTKLTAKHKAQILKGARPEYEQLKLEHKEQGKSNFGQP